MLVFEMSIRENIARVRERMAAACRRAGRSPDDVTLIGVSKGFPVDAVREACAAGLRDVGENRVQEAAGKIDALSALSEAPRWHLVGHLQANKAKTAAGLFAMIHSVDSLRLAQALSRHADESVSVFIEVNVAQEASKFGLPPNEVTSLLPSINALPALDVRGLMTVAPETDDPEAVRPIFRQLRELRDSSGLCELSMGMTGDFEVAIEEGATMVRVGRAIFGPRPER